KHGTEINDNYICLTTHLTNRELVNMKGLSRETVSMTLTQIRKEQLISTNNAGLIVLDIDAMEAEMIEFLRYKKRYLISTMLSLPIHTPIHLQKYPAQNRGGHKCQSLQNSIQVLFVPQSDSYCKADPVKQYITTLMQGRK